MKIVIAFFLIWPITLLAQLGVAVSLQPQAWFVDQIGGDRVKTVVMIPPGSSPHSYEPRPTQMAALFDATLYLAVGVEFEKAWLGRFADNNPHMRIAHTDRMIAKIEGAPHHHDEEDHHREHHNGFMDIFRGWFGGTSHDGHHHQTLDLHIWTSPQLALLQARAITQALCGSDPAYCGHYHKNYAKLSRHIVDLDNQITAMMAPYRNRSFLVHHPAWGYFALDYGLIQHSVEVDGKEPKPAQLKKLIDQAQAQGTRTLFVQPQFSKRSAEVIAQAIGGHVAEIDPLAYEWDTNLLHTAQKLKASFDAPSH